MRMYRFVFSKQALIVFLVFSMVAGVFLATPAHAQTIAGNSGPFLHVGNSTDTWSLLTGSPSTPPARQRHTMAATPSGNVLLFGGSGSSGYLNDTWLFDTAANSWSQITGSAAPAARRAHAMAATPSGVLLFGGWDGSSYLNDTWLFNTATNGWSPLTITGSIPLARYQHAMAATPSGNVLLYGGFNGTRLDDTWLFDTAANSWSQITGSATPPARNGHAMAATPSGDVLLFGGYNGTNPTIDDTWLFDTAANSWSQITGSATPAARYIHAMATTPEGVLLFGGYNNFYVNGTIDDTWLFDTTANNWSQITGSATPAARYYHAMATTPEGVLLFGGWDGFSLHFNDTWLYGPATLVPTHTVTISLQPNWNMISLPLMPTSTDPQVVFGGLPSPWYLFEWDPLGGTYIGKELIVLDLEAGYWLKVPTAVDYPVSGLPNEAAQTGINLGFGWNLIGVPYEGTIPWGGMRVSKDGGALVMLNQAISSDWIQGMFFHWNGSTYEMLTGGSFQSLFGYWVKAKVTGLQLVFLQP